MDIEYLPNKGFILNSVKFEWNNKRGSVRGKLGMKHKEDDKIIDVADFFDGDESMNIHQKRDVYENLNSKKDVLFLNYDKENRLRDLEVHYGFDIIIDNIRLKFGTEISDLIEQFKKNGIEYSELEKGNYFLPKLKITIADSKAMGGVGNELSYFYGTSDISHLTE